MQIIPIQANIPSQRFSITLDEVAYNFAVNWNTRAARWFLDIADENDVDIVNALALTSGVDLLAPFNFTLAGPLRILDLTSEGNEATLTNIGTETALVYGD